MEYLKKVENVPDGNNSKKNEVIVHKVIKKRAISRIESFKPKHFYLM